MVDIIENRPGHLNVPAPRLLKDMGNGTWAEVVYVDGVTVNVGDVELGAVEIKNDSDDTRAKVGPGTSANGLRTVTSSNDPFLTANHTDLAAILAKLTSDPATQTTLAAILAKIIAAPATEAKQDSLITANHTDLAAILAKLTSDPATQTTLAAALATLGATSGAAVITDANGTIQQYLRGLVKQWIAGTLIVGAGENHLGSIGGHVARISSSFTRPSDTNAYALGDLVANNTVANSVTPMSFALSRTAGAGGMIRRLRLRKTGTTITNASFRLHLYSVSPTQTGGAGANTGDNAAWSTDQANSYVGSIDVTCDKAFTDGASGNGIPNVGSEINFTADTYYGLLEARAAYAPANAEQFTLLLEVLQN